MDTYLHMAKSLHCSLDTTTMLIDCVPIQNKGVKLRRERKYQACYSFCVSFKVMKIYFPSVQFNSVQSLSRDLLFATPWITACQASLSIIIFRRSLRLTVIESVIPSSHLILCRPLLLLPTIPPSIRVFSNESAPRIKWPKYWSFSFRIRISPSNEYPGLISFRIDWFDLLAVQEILKSPLQYHFRLSAFFMVWFSHRYMTTGKPQP